MRALILGLFLLIISITLMVQAQSPTPTFTALDWLNACCDCIEPFGCFSPAGNHSCYTCDIVPNAACLPGGCQTFTPTPTGAATPTALPPGTCCNCGDPNPTSCYIPESGGICLGFCTRVDNAICDGLCRTYTPTQTPTPTPRDTSTATNTPTNTPTATITNTPHLVCVTLTPTIPPVKIFRIPRVGSTDLTSNRFEKQTVERYAVACTFQRQLKHDERIDTRLVTFRPTIGSSCSLDVLDSDYIDEQRIVIIVDHGSDGCSYQFDLKATTNFNRILVCSLLMDVKNPILD